MKKHFKIWTIVFTLLFALLALFGCTETSDKGDVTEEGEEEEIPEVNYALISTIAVSESDNLESTGFLLESFKISDIKLTVSYVEDSDPAYVEIPLTLSMIRAEDKAKLSVSGTHTIHVIYGKYETSFNLKLYSETVSKCKIVFMDDAGNRVGDVQYLNPNEIAVVPNLQTKEGYEFVGWKIQNSDTIVTSYKFSTDTTLVAYYKPVVFWVEFCYKLNDLEYSFGDGTNKVYVPKGGDAYDYAPELPVFTGFSNGRWENRDAMKNVSENGLKFTAVYDKDYVDATFVYYKFESPEGEVDSLYNYKVYWKVAEATEGISAPEDVEKATKRIFRYWYTLHDGVKTIVSFPYVLTAETVFYAEYDDVYTGTEGLHFVYQNDIEHPEGYYIDEYTGESDIVAIPTKYNEMNVVGLIGNPFVGKAIRSFSVTNDNEVFRIYKEALYSSDLKILYAYPSQKEETSFVVDSETVKPVTIYEGAFYGAKLLTSIKIPQTVTSIGNYAFYQCSGLEKIVIPDGITIIGDYAFFGNEQLRSVEISEKSGLERIGAYAFAFSGRLKSIFIPYPVNYIGKGLLMGCVSLERINISEGQTNYTVENGCLYGKLGTNSYYYLYAYPSLYSGISKNGLVAINNSTGVVCTGAFYYCAIGGISYTNGASQKLVLEEKSVVCPTMQALVFTAEQPNFDADAFGGYAPQHIYFATRNNQTKDDAYIEYLKGFLSEENIHCMTSTASVSYKNDAGLFYVLEGDEATVIGYRGNQTNLVLPDVLDNCPVTKIGKNAFRGNNALQSVTFSKNIVTVGEYAFAECPLLTTVTLNGKNLKTIGDYAFADSTSLRTVNTETATRISEFGMLPFLNTEIAKSELLILAGVLITYDGNDEIFNVPDGVYIIADYAFKDATSLSQIVFSNNSLLTKIQSYAFENCSVLTDVVFPDGLLSIGENAFDGCKCLFAVVLPKETTYAGDIYQSVPHVFKKTDGTYTYYFDSEEKEGYYIVKAPNQNGDGWFGGWYTEEGCENYVSFPVVLTENTHYYSLRIEQDDVRTNGFDFRAVDGGYEVTRYKGSDTVVSVPNSFNGGKVIGIASNAITDAAVLHVLLPETIQYVRKNAFEGSGFLANQTGESVRIGHVLVRYTGARVSYGFPQEITVIADGAFEGNTYLERVYFHDGIQIVPQDCFRSCLVLKSVSFGKGLLAIEKGAFATCTNLRDLSFEVAKNLRDIDRDAFEGSAWLIEHIDDSVVINSIYYRYIGSNDLLHIPNGITYVNPYAFYQNQTLRFLYLSESVESIGKYAFAETKIEKIFFPSDNNNLTTIEEYAFYGCTSACDFDIRNCSKLVTIGEGAFAGILSLPEQSLHYYIPAKVEYIGKGAFAESQVITVQFEEESRLEILPAECFRECNDLLSVRFLGESNLTVIEQKAFYGCVSLHSFSDTSCYVERIGEKAFFGCVNLTVFHVTESYLRTVDAYAFTESDSTVVMSMLGTVLLAYNGIASEVHIPEDTTIIANNAFGGNDRIKTVIIDGNGIDTIQEFAFAGCTSLKSIEIPSTVQKITAGSFLGCTSLESIVIVREEETESVEGYVSVTGILYRYYEENDKKYAELVAYPNKRANNFTIPVSILVNGENYDVVTVCDYAFYGCTDLTKISFATGSKVKTIGKEAFRHCVNVGEFVLPSCVEVIGMGAFAGCTSVTKFTVNAGKYFANGDLYYIGSTETTDDVVAVLCCVADASTAETTFTIPEFVTVGETNYEVYGVDTLSFENSHYEKIADSRSIIPEDYLIGFEGLIER